MRLFNSCSEMEGADEYCGVSYITALAGLTVKESAAAVYRMGKDSRGWRRSISK